jgi:hypothetical protein
MADKYRAQADTPSHLHLGKFITKKVNWNGFGRISKCLCHDHANHADNPGNWHLMAASASALNAIKPAGMVDIDDFDDPDAQQKARQQLHDPRFILVGGVVLILTGLIGIIALQLTTLQELIGTELAFTLLYAAILISGAILGTFYVVMRR